MLKKKMESLFTNFDFSKLEFNKILNDVANLALSEKGKAKIINIIPDVSSSSIKEVFNKLNQLINYFINEEKLTLSIIYNFEKQLEDSKRNIIINEIPLYQLAYSIRLYFDLSRKLDNKNYPDLKKFFSIEKINSDFYHEILKYFDADGNIDSKISAELKRIRDSLSGIEGKIRKETDSFFKYLKGLNYTSDDIISIRDGFSCIAVKSNYKNRVDGIIMDSSSTGQTVYITPKKAIQLHNEFVYLKDEEKKEIRRILDEYTKIVFENVYELEVINNELIEFDVFYAKVLYSLSNELNIPEIIDKKRIKILSGKHPLLGKGAVPLDIAVGDDFRIIVITGPNTGGKTVVLKTIGLFVLMVQSGIPIPASSTSQFYIFDKIFVDIGDEQSIEQSLSTFSAHLKKIIELIKLSDKNSLILLDEFCSGTDPAEGSALAISILQELLNKNIMGVVTTHYSALKYFATEADGVENASMEFDTVKLIPTYRLNIGIPGSSKALEISARLGMPQYILENAKESLNEEYVNVEKLMEKLERQKLELEKNEKQLNAKNERLNNFLLELEEKSRILEKREHELKNIQRSGESDFLKEKRREFELLVKNIKTKNASKDSIKDGKYFFEKMKVHLNESKIDQKIIDKMQEFKIGDRVKIVSKDVKGTILDEGNKDGEYLVQAGLIKMNFMSDDLVLINENNKTKLESSYKAPSVKSQLTLDLRGSRYEEAEKKLDKFVEQAMINKINRIRIIHGMGTGALRNCIKNYFDNSPFIVSYDFEKGPNENSTNFGVTVAELG